MPPKKQPLPDDVKRIIQNHRNFMKHQHRYGPSINVTESKNPTSSNYSNQSTQLATANSNQSKTAKTVSETRVVIQQPSEDDVKQIPVDSSTNKKTPPRLGSEKKRKED